MEIDSTYLQEVRTDPRFNYLEELGQKAETSTVEPDHNLGYYISEFYSKNEDVMKFCSYIVVIALLGILLFQGWKRFSPTFEAAEDSHSGMGNDTIYNHDWEPEIKRMMEAGKYSEAVVLCYLRWLDLLNAKHIIAFSQSKTPEMFMKEVTEYVRKADKPHHLDPLEQIEHLEQLGHLDQPDRQKKLDKLIPKTRRLTDQYLLVRYGHRIPTKALAEEMIAL